MVSPAPHVGYAAVDGLEIYYEVCGSGPPLVLLHGGLLGIELNFADLLPALADRHLTVALELQGHGRTADSDRMLSLDRLARDVTEVLDVLGVGRADVLGVSLGGLVAVELGLGSPERVDRLVLVSIATSADGYHEEINAPDARPGQGRMPTPAEFRAMEAFYRSVAPDPDHFEAFASKAGAFVGGLPGWSPDELAGITAPTLILVGDRDFVRVEHAAAMHEAMPEAWLAVVPGATHMGLLHHTDVVVPILHRFFDRLSEPAGGGAVTQADGGGHAR